MVAGFSVIPEQDLRTRYHPDLSQLGWHLMHVAFIEQYWLREIVLADDSRTKGLQEYYFPELIKKDERGNLPAITDFEQLQGDFSDTETLWQQLSSSGNNHPLLSNGYLGWFLVQHGEQHAETMHMVLYQRALTAVTESLYTARHFDAMDPVFPSRVIAGGGYEAGSDNILACDNEQPVHTVLLPAYMIAAKPVSNAEYLGFMQDGGYQQPQFWSEDGWQWVSDCQHIAPEHWQQDDLGNWYMLTADGQCDIEAGKAVFGLSWYEADAFARYAGCRLPHEFEWEIAMKQDPELLSSTGQAWEWCANIFFPYPGFKAFPYQRYSTPWFDSNHYLSERKQPL